MTIRNDTTGEIRQAVQEHYGRRARLVIDLADVTPAPDAAAGAGCGAENCGHGSCGGDDCGHSAVGGDSSAATASEGGDVCCGPADTERAMALYNEAQLQGLPVAAMAASAGCGNPTALADLRPGETVLDLGSGGGIDCFIAAEQVGASGRVFGLDMTPDMLALANANRERMGLDNVEFIEGHLEDIPLPDASVDVVISNCVICLSPDKDAVFREAWRVLAPGAGCMFPICWHFPKRGRGSLTPKPGRPASAGRNTGEPIWRGWPPPALRTSPPLTRRCSLTAKRRR